VEATIVTTAGDQPVASAPATPPLSGALLVAVTPSADEDLPAAGTNLPLFGALGVVCLSLGLALLSFRRPVRQS